METDNKKTINYNIKQLLSTKYLKYKKKRAHICVYNIVNENVNPLLLYLLYKYQKSSIISFPNFIVENDMLEEATKIFNNITNTIIEPDGYLIYDDEIYIFFNLKIIHKMQDFYESKNELWWTTIDEICNSKKVINFDVHRSVSDMFLNNVQFIYLLNDKNESYLIPRIGYYGCYYKIMSYIGLLGVQQSTHAPYGNFFYFNTFKRSIKYGGWSFVGTEKYNKKYIKLDKHNRYDKGGIVRFAVFLHNSKMFLNHPKDNNTEYNELNKDKIYDEFPKLVDLTGKWAENNDSAYVGILDLIKKNGEKKVFHKNIKEQYIIKDIDNYMCLSSHIIDKNSLGNVWDYNDEYKIL